MYDTALRCIVSHAKENSANRKRGKPLHILRYATDNLQRVVFNATFTPLPASNRYAGVLLKTPPYQLRCFLIPANVSNEQNSSDHIRKFSEDFRILSKFSKIVKTPQKRF